MHRFYQKIYASITSEKQKLYHITLDFASAIFYRSFCTLPLSLLVRRRDCNTSLGQEKSTIKYLSNKVICSITD